MIGSRLFRCSILAYFVLFGAAVARPADNSFQQSARDLAEKIVAALPSRDGFSVEVRNASSLTAAQANQVEHAMREELQSRGTHTFTGAVAPIRLVVTLSENFKGLLWTAEIHDDDSAHSDFAQQVKVPGDPAPAGIIQGDRAKIVMLAVPRTAAHSGQDDKPVILRSEMFWQGTERILGAAVVTNSSSEDGLVFLVPEGLKFQKMGSDVIVKTEIASAQTATRSPSGNFVQIGNELLVGLGSISCTVNIDTHLVVECEEVRDNTPFEGRWPFQFVGSLAPWPSTIGNQVVPPLRGCAVGQFLGTGPGDDTQPDVVQMFENENFVGVSNILSFPGPVTALHNVTGTPTAVVRNLRTGNYEAYRISVLCPQ